KDEATSRFIINELYSTEKSFYQFLNFIRIQNDTINPAKAVGQIFRELEPDFAIFLKYSIHYQHHMKAIRRASNTSYVVKIDNELRRSKKENIHRLGLADYLIAPFQRVPRYELLLKGNIRKTVGLASNSYC
ncbi:MAG: Dbl homology domain-containing protein, partial [Benjaminiella poitrasii]